MRLARWASTAIYLVYVSCLTWAFDAHSFGTSQTEIIGITDRVAPVLPAMLVAAALTAQFSAALAGTAGCGGLLEELPKGKLRSQVG
ncbi:MAG: hypothetical protein KDB53_10190 [Planctomycetes bacterium]|nr:hypothetical protein [Planctomycetota bacterium]